MKDFGPAVLAQGVDDGRGGGMRRVVVGEQVPGHDSQSVRRARGESREEPGEHEAARRLGVVEYLIKPLSHEKLDEALARLGVGIKTVLIVDDEEDELHLFARMLEANEQRYSVLQVTTGQRALSMLRSRQPHVLLLDLMMPGMNGFQVLEEKARDPLIRDIPVIIISSRDPAGDLIVSNTLTVTQGAGLSQRNLVACIQALGKILAPVSVQENRG